jgi:hypothetical protein
MVKKILTEAGFVEGETFIETQFISPPRATYAVYFNSFTRRGADGLNLLKEHSITIEIYSEFGDPEAEARLEAVLDRYGIEFEKDDRYWIQSEQLYQTVYTFDFITK